MRRQALLGLVLAAAAALPFLLPKFQAFEATQIMIYALAILGLSLLTGYNGQISLGHGAFYAIGAYATAILMDRAGLPYWAAVPIAGAVSFLLGFLFGFPALRLGGHYLALATFALALAVPQLLKWKMIADWTGGVQGIFIDKPAAPAWLPLNPDQFLYFIVLATVLLLFWCAANLLRGRIGRAIRAIREQPLAAETAGIDIALYKTVVFGISALYTGVAGALGALIVQFVSPDSFTMFLSIFLMVGLVVGGATSLWGAFLGAAFITITPNLAASVSKSATAVIYAGVMILIVYWLPGGLSQTVDALRRTLWGDDAPRRTLRGGGAAPPPER